MNIENIKIYIGEVVNGGRATYSPDAKVPFEVQVKIISNSKLKKPINAIPLTVNELQIPVLGEIVIIFESIKDNSKPGDKNTQWYYTKPMSLSGNVNQNLLPGISDKKLNKQIFKRQKSSKQILTKSISNIQPFVGDIIYQGRWGNVIRLGATNTSRGSGNEPGYGGTIGDPIIILSNIRKTKNNKISIVENINTDPSSIYLTSTQKLKDLKLNHNLTINTSPTYTEFANSQLIGTADRIILTAKNDIIVLDSPEGIEINSKDIRLGINKEKESMLYSGQVKKVLQGLIDIVSTGFKTSDGAIATKLHTPLEDLNNLMANIDNDNIKVDKYTSNTNTIT
jgi:hypothetical protein